MINFADAGPCTLARPPPLAQAQRRPAPLDEWQVVVAFVKEFQMFKQKPRPGPDYELVFSRTIRLRNGRVLVAKHYGLKCFAFWVRRKK